MNVVENVNWMYAGSPTQMKFAILKMRFFHVPLEP